MSDYANSSATLYLFVDKGGENPQKYIQTNLLLDSSLPMDKMSVKTSPMDNSNTTNPSRI